jgi:hypothetical protein
VSGLSFTFDEKKQRRSGSWGYLAATFVLGLALATIIPARLAGSLSFYFKDTPLVAFDYSFMQYAIDYARTFWEQSGHLYGYTPEFLGGVGFSFVWNPYQLFQLLSVMFSLSGDQIVKLSVFICAFSAPLLTFASLRNFGETPRSAFVVTLAVMAWAGADLPCAFLVFGMPSGFLLIFGSLYAISTGAKLLSTGVPSPGFFVILPIMFMAHKASALVIGLPLIIFWLFHLRKASLISQIMLIGMGLVVVATNLFWISPLIEHFGYREFLPGRLFWVGERLAEFNDSLGITSFGLLNFFRIFLALLALEGIFSWRANKNKERANAFAIIFLLYAAFIWGGEHFEITSHFYPKRFLPHLFILLFPAAAEGARLLGSYLLGSRKASRFSFLLPAMALFTIIAGTTYFQTTANKPFSRRITAVTEDVAKWIDSVPSNEGRIFFEDVGVFRDEPTYGLNIFGSFPGPMLGIKTRGQFIGGPYPHIPLKHNYSNFGAGYAFGKKIGELTADELAEFIEQYNITRAVCWSDEAKLLFKENPQLFVPDGTIGPVKLFRVNGGGGWIYGGKASVSADRGIIIVSNLVQEEEFVVLKYHYDPRLKDPRGKVEIQPIQINKDPVQYIRLINPPTDFVLVDY